MILRLRPACLLISQIRVPEIGIEYVLVYVLGTVIGTVIGTYSARDLLFRPQLACVPNRLRFVSRRTTTPSPMLSQMIGARYT